MIIGLAAAALIVVGVGIWLIARPSPAPESQVTAVVEATPEPTETPEQPPSPTAAPEETTPSTPIPAATSEPTAIAPTPPEPAPPVNVQAKVDVDLNSAENQRIRQEVLKRIDVMPNLSESDKDKLYAQVERARGMGKVITIPFATGQTRISSQEIDDLKKALDAPQVARLAQDPTVVFVILGFADTRGDAKVNLRVSLDRAESVMDALRNKAGLMNVMQPVAMGGSELFDSGDLAKNRVAEVWAVLP